MRPGLLLALVAVVQLPAAVAAFVPIPHPAIHLAAFVGSLSLTAFSLRYVRRLARSGHPDEAAVAQTVN